MSSSIRQLALDTIVSRLQGINTTNGYSRDVEVGSVYFVKETLGGIPTPAILVIQNDEVITKQYSELYECVLDLDIGFVDSGAYLDPSAEINRFLVDIQIAMGVEFTITAPKAISDITTTGTVQLREVSNAITVTDSIPTLLMGRVTYKVTYRRNILDPTKI